ncbi:DUF4349 domain-containing protein [Chitinophaga horti]|uniref:DUF4349 domain-containing protein n=1 Tax=Chitinophaga horti TaxID=2920382 RepID=A0ABY6J622_9BACT|nr:DUF4349 domain-containing protein [Chitinophaga horti]UYQ95133.1 DUF4349 domain-containing protein [Chitinophaga horti]
MITRIPIITLVCFLVLTGCRQRQAAAVEAQVAASARAEEEAAVASKQMLEAKDDMVAANSYALADLAIQAAPPVAPPQATITQKIIRNATVSFSVDNYEKIKAQIRQSITGHKGYISSENETRNDLEARTTMQVRVPADKFDACLAGLAGFAKQLDEKNITSEDVTKQYVDTEARMLARKAVEQRYLAILQKAGKVEDILAVEEKLNETREEIEAAEASLRYMDQQVAMSTITLNFYQPFAQTVHNTPGFFGRLGISLKEGWNNVLDAALGVTAAWPAWLLLIVAFFAGKRIYKRFKKEKTVAV